MIPDLRDVMREMQDYMASNNGRLRHLGEFTFNHNRLVIERPSEPGVHIKQYRENIVNSLVVSFERMDARLVNELQRRICALILELDKTDLPPHDPTLLQAVYHDATLGKIIQGDSQQ